MKQFSVRKGIDFFQELRIYIAPNFMSLSMDYKFTLAKVDL